MLWLTPVSGFGPTSPDERRPLIVPVAMVGKEATTDRTRQRVRAQFDDERRPVPCIKMSSQQVSSILFALYRLLFPHNEREWLFRVIWSSHLSGSLHNEMSKYWRMGPLRMKSVLRRDGQLYLLLIYIIILLQAADLG